MDTKTAQVLYEMSEFASERGQWFQLCEYLQDKGVRPGDIARVINNAAAILGNNETLRPEDCI